MSKEKTSRKREENVITTNPLDIVPKLCNIINFGKINENNILLTFLFKDPTSGQTVLLDRYTIDKNHAKQVVEVLNNLLK